MHVIAYDPYLTREAAERQGVEAVELDELLARADFITIHEPLTGDMRHLLGEDALARVKSAVRIIHCARRGIVDERALPAAIRHWPGAGAAHDVVAEDA